jgi:predicted nucleic acid-binding protein
LNIFVDACIVIYLVEGNESFSRQIADAMLASRPAAFCANDLVRLECLVGPLRSGSGELRSTYDQHFESLRMLEMNSDVFTLAAQIRAHQGLRTPDALHAATAIYHRCDELWTGDSRFAVVGDRMTVRVFAETHP